MPYKRTSVSTGEKKFLRRMKTRLNKNIKSKRFNKPEKKKMKKTVSKIDSLLKR